ncbi:MAG: MBL fold metallo-hydrolase, partial [Parasporobacterium sp.]|nr:MBL fold metallo-hydrolase [Parasporobacterium sp.]
MYELIQISEHDYYIDCPAKTGLVQTGDKTVIAIDSGNDKDAGKKVLRHIEAKGWTLTAVFNTHSHADHIGGNRFLQERTGCHIYAPGMENVYTNNPQLEPVTLFGGLPFKDISGKFMMAQSSSSELLTPDVLPAGMEIIPLPGHSFDMVG